MKPLIFALTDHSTDEMAALLHGIVTTAVGAVTGGFGVPAILGALGFGAAGPVAGTIAALWQSTTGGAATPTVGGGLVGVGVWIRETVANCTLWKWGG